MHKIYSHTSVRSCSAWCLDRLRVHMRIFQVSVTMAHLHALANARSMSSVYPHVKLTNLQTDVTIEPESTLAKVSTTRSPFSTLALT